MVTKSDVNVVNSDRSVVHVYCVDGDFLNSQMFQQQPGYEVVHQLEKASVVVFPGGSDVNPKLYGEARHPTTGISDETDRRHKQYFEASLGKLCVGICRGGQFLNVMSGGRMFQNVDKHAINGTHPVIYVASDGMDECYGCTSTHHQMFRRDKNKSELWGYAARATFKETSREVFVRTDVEFGNDEEIVWYPETKCLCFQPHPEYESKSCRDLFFICLERAMRLS